MLGLKLDEVMSLRIEVCHYSEQELQGFGAPAAVAGIIDEKFYHIEGCMVSNNEGYTALGTPSRALAPPMRRFTNLGHHGFKNIGM